MTEGWEHIIAIVDSAAPVEAPEIPLAVSPHKSAPRQRRSDRSSSVSGQPPPSDAAAENSFAARAELARESESRRENDALGEQKSPDNSSDSAACADSMTGNFAADSSSRGPDKPSTAGARKKPKAEASAGGDDEPPEARTFGFSVDDLNCEFAFVVMGSKAVVFWEQPNSVIEDQKRMLSLDAFNAWFENKFTERVDRSGKIVAVTWANAWRKSPQRRSYRGIEFFPDSNAAPGTPGYLNLWTGFAIKPAKVPDAKRYKTFRDHLLTNVCSGDTKLFAWVFGFFAHMVQRPRERIGVALVLRGGMGTGKTKVGEVIGRIFPRHYCLVDDPRYVTGQFNAHMATCLLLQADEAVWAGDRAAAGRLKGLITSPSQPIEAKGVDPIWLSNYVRLIFTSNEDWVVPAGKDERRFAVLDVDPRCAQNHDYFREMDAELQNGGIEHLLADLLAFDLASVDLRKVPRTDALLEQKIRTLDSVESWWFGRLRSGTSTRRAGGWEREVACTSLFSDYIATAEQIGVHRKQEETVFGMKMAKLLPGGVDRRKRNVQVEDEHGVGGAFKRVWCYMLPSLAEARAHFEQIVNQAVDWPADDPVADESREREDDEVKL
jgi:hypothetical protein